MNRFLDDQLPLFASFGDPNEGAVFYARFGQGEANVPVDDGPPRTFVRLEAFYQTWFDQNPPPAFTASSASDNNFVRYYSEARIALLEVEFTMDHTGSFSSLKDLLSAAEGDEEPGQWFRVVVGGPRGSRPISEVVPVTVHVNLFAGGTARTLEGIGPVDEEIGKLLDEAVDTGHLRDADEADLDRLLGHFSGTRIPWAVVYDVGQGNAIGLCSSRGVLAYFDLGGGCGPNKSTFPVALTNFCFSQDPPIILSHWDEDHWSSASRDTRSLRGNWIAPRQKLGPAQAGLIASIQGAGGTVWLLPGGFKKTRYGQIQLELGTGSSRNNSGIIVTLSENADGTGQQMLMPGDAGYKFIPSYSGGSPYVSIVASHHGGALGSSTPPACPAATHSRLVYSAGPGNTYHHPLLATRQTHDGVGWNDSAVGSIGPDLVLETSTRGSTGLGHVYLGWGSTLHLPALPCGRLCSLEPEQS